MCGIIGILDRNATAATRAFDSLRRLEYRGYDSAGIVTIDDGKFQRRRVAGKLKNLEARLHDEPLPGRTALGHTRWATHGKPTVINAHPHIYGPVALVHNGIIENFRDLHDELVAKGHVFETATDSETIVHLIAHYVEAGDTPKAAVQKSMARLKGAFALAILFAGDDDLLIGARRGSPLVIGIGAEGEAFLGSDALSIAPLTNRVVYLEENDWCALTRKGYTVYSGTGEAVTRPISVVQDAGPALEKGNYRHFMQKEIFEQPESTARVLDTYTDPLASVIELPGNVRVDIDWAGIDHVLMVACGTAHYATRIAEYWFEQQAGLAVKTDIASEFRYRQPVLPTQGGLALFVSQSGETADTLAALRYCKQAGLKTMALVNVPSSSIAREADFVLPTPAGPEIGVASTKAFTAQLVTLLTLALMAGQARGKLSDEAIARHLQTLRTLPRLMTKTLMLDAMIADLAQTFSHTQSVIYLGRGLHYPIALEGALKLKEISYIHAEGYAGGELKHGPLALVDQDTPVVFIAPHDDLFAKSLSNLQEVAARHAEIILIGNGASLHAARNIAAHTIEMPDCDPLISPILYALPIQMLAYHVAVEKGTDADQPRNLAKSVTVE